jgi:hypothetical protein
VILLGSFLLFWLPLLILTGYCIGALLLGLGY